MTPLCGSEMVKHGRTPRQVVELAGRLCEHALISEDAAVNAGDLDMAAYCADRAERWSMVAFGVAHG